VIGHVRYWIYDEQDQPRCSSPRLEQLVAVRRSSERIYRATARSVGLPYLVLIMGPNAPRPVLTERMFHRSRRMNERISFSVRFIP